MISEDLIHYLRESAARHPDHADRWYGLALALGASGQLGEALRSVERALELHPPYADAALSRVFLLGEAGRVDYAFRQLRSLGTGQTESFQVVLSRALFFLRHGWKDDGLRQLVRAERLKPNLPYLRLFTAAAFLERGDACSAQARLERGRRSLRNMRLELLAPGDLDALAPYGRWDDPALLNLPVLAAECHLASGAAREAEEDLRRGCAGAPGHAGVMAALGRTLLALGKDGEAGCWLAAAVVADETADEALLELGFVRAACGDLEQAEKALEAAVVLRPLYPDYRYHLGLFLLELARPAEAREQFERALRLHPGYADAAVQLAGLYLEEGAAAAALRVLEAHAADEWPESLVLKAQAHLERGARAEARRALEEALARDSSHAEARELLATLGTE